MQDHRYLVQASPVMANSAILGVDDGFYLLNACFFVFFCE